MRKYISLLLILTVVFSSCETEDPIPTYDLTTIVIPEDGGKINISPQSFDYKEGEEVTLTPAPNEGWLFESWGGDVSGSSTPLQITMNSNKSVVALFQKRNYPLNITIEGEGTVEERIVTNPSGREYPHGTTVELAPKPKEGWLFESWGGDLTGTESPKIITLDKEKNVTVKFKRRDYPLKITIEGEGTIEERIVINPLGREYPHGTTVELTPKPKEGWEFESWGGDLSGVEVPEIITVDKGKNVLAKFVQISLNSNFSLHPNGITCLCPNSQVGEKGLINSIEYEAVDNLLLRKRIAEKSDLSKLCTSLVTDLSTDNDQGLFIWGVNHNIQSWDVSNVVNMKWMFINASFNQPIGIWNVSKVQNMQGLFQNSDFNQNIANWDVGNVKDMSWMFMGSMFNKDISKWCVTKILSEPQNFSTNSPLTSEKKPKWGTCQSELLAPNFHNTVWVGDESYEPCDCGFSGIIGFNDYVIFELGEFGSKEPTGCFPYNFWYRDENSKVENLKIEESKISFNLKNNIWDWFTVIEIIGNKLVITSSTTHTSGNSFSWTQKYVKSPEKFSGFCN
ncbi:InlB B-repeat-containing protein [Mongoliibacter ruber]|uniref:Uncharacterized protein DUF285 n=1 Tax=Mongoliibacter ruber TaxID=1750599 RepID=A0A2T0WGV1_9BACT|nr:BspA family leucine-rich repeat surface protein [Mongoliibacter ruber]PRY85885.1 uncharacterized protein DUF285 [Mongoliibacter ruber]